MFEIVIQASINGIIFAKSIVKSIRKNVTDKCYGGDASRKFKLLEKQIKSPVKDKVDWCKA